MVQFRRLDPLANAGPYQRLQKTPVKSFTLTEVQFDRLKERRPDLIVHDGDDAVLGLPTRDYLTVHYGYSETEFFRDRFAPMFSAMVSSSSRAEAPRGVVLSFRDRPNRNLADVVLWSLAFEEGEQWVEMNLIMPPEMPEPANTIEGGFTVREATAADRDTIADIEAEATGNERLTGSGLDSLYEDARWLYIVADAGGAPVAYLNMTREPGGWGVITEARIRPAQVETLRKLLFAWAVAFLRNNGGRRIRHQVYMSDASGLALLREAGFTPGETGLEYTRAVDQVEIQSKLDARKEHGTLIKFGDWR